MKKSIVVLCCALFVGANALDFKSIVSEGAKVLGGSSTVAGSDYQTQGLKKALEIGTEYAIKSLGGEGFLNSFVKIPMPKSLQSAANLASKMGGQKYVDDFVKTMNLAAGEAVPKTASIFSDTIRALSVEDATKLINGGENSITEYFKKKTSSKLMRVVAPIVEKATDENGVTSAYKSLVGVTKGSSFISNDLLNQAKGVANVLGVDSDALPLSGEDLNAYVTRKTLDGMFSMIAQEEAKIRANPLSYSSDIIRKVFKR